MAASRRGHCLCGALRFTARVPKAEMSTCHCGFCRRWAGGPFLVVDGITDLVFEAGEPSVYASSEWGERGFCGACGSLLFWRSRDGAHCALSAYVFEDEDPLAFTSEIFIDRKPADYAFANDTRKMTGDEVFAAFSEAGAEPNG